MKIKNVIIVVNVMSGFKGRKSIGNKHEMNIILKDSNEN